MTLELLVPPPASVADPGRRPVRVALYSGLYLHHDAISDSLHHKVRILDELAAAGEAIELTIFAHASDYDDPRVRNCATASDVLHTRAFWDADVHIYEFGIHYGLFDTVFCVPVGRRRIAIYHNITPRELVTDADGLEAIDRTLVQKHNLMHVDQIACDSRYNADDLLEFDVPAERLSVLHLPPRCVAEPAPGPRPVTDGIVNLLFVGRIVRAKGVLDLVRAVAALPAELRARCRLRMVGNLRLSEPDTVAEVQDLIAAAGLDRTVELLGELDDVALARLLERSHALTIPSYHEGYCVPVLEALHAGCQIVGYRSGNIPHIAGGLGRLVPPGDIRALSDAIATVVHEELDLAVENDRRRHVDAGDLDPLTWVDAARAHVASFGEGAYREGFLALLRGVTAPAIEQDKLAGVAI